MVDHCADEWSQWATDFFGGTFDALGGG